MRALPWLVLPLAAASLPGCAQDKPPALLTTVPLKSPIHPGDAFYPAEACALTDLKGLAPLPADVAMVTAVKDARALLDRAGMIGLLQKGDQPYDRVLTAVTQRMLGMPLNTLQALRDAGLDPDQPLGLAYLHDIDGVSISFMAVKDGEALAGALKRWGKEQDASVQSRKEGDATMLRIKGDEVPFRIVVLRDGYAYFVSSGRSDEQKRIMRAAKALSKAAPGEGLLSSDGFKRATSGVRYGELMASYLTPAFWFGQELALQKEKLENATKRAKRYRKLLTEAEEDKKARHRDQLIERYTSYTKRYDGERTAAEQRIEEMTALSKAVPGVAVGLEVGATGLRYKLFAALSDGAGLGSMKDNAVADKTTAADKPAAADKATAADKSAAVVKTAAADKAAEPAKKSASDEPRTSLWTHTQPEGLHAHVKVPPAGLSAAIEQAAQRARLGSIENIFNELDLNYFAWLAHLDGELMLLGTDPSQRRDLIAGVLALRLRDAEAARTAWDKAMASDKAAKLIADDKIAQDKETGLWRYAYYHIAFAGDWLLIGATSGALEEQIKVLQSAGDKSWLSRIPEPTVASLEALEGHGAAFLHIPSNQLLPDAQGRLGALRSAAEFGIIGMLGSGGFGRSIGSGLFGELTKKAERLQKRIAKTRAKLQSLRRRQRIAKESGRKRVFTALGSSLLWVRPVDGGLAGYGAQLFGEPNVADVLEMVTWHLVDSSEASDTAQEIAEMEQKLKGLEKAFDKMESDDKFKDGGGFGALIGDSPPIGNILGSDIGMIGIGSDAVGLGGLGSRGSGPGGGGTGEGLGGLGTKGLGSGTGRGFGSRGGGRLSGGSSDDTPRPRRKRR